MRIVEIGPGSKPAYNISRRLREKLDSGAEYIGIDVKPEIIEEITRNERAVMVGGDLKRIPLPDGVADEIWSLNVLSEGLVVIRDKLPDGHYLSSHMIFREWNRILKPNGTIFVGEWLPYVLGSWIIEADYKKCGLSNQLYTGEALQDFVTQHGIDFSIISKCIKFNPHIPPFFMTFKKTGQIESSKIVTLSA